VTGYVPLEFPSADTVARDIAMWRAWVGGVRIKDIAVEHGFSPNRVSQIMCKMRDGIVRRVFGPTWHRLLNPPLSKFRLTRPSGRRLVAPFPPWIDEALEGVWIESIVDAHLAEEVHRFYTDAYPKGRIIRIKDYLWGKTRPKK
jgi:hypothetical protein